MKRIIILSSILLLLCAPTYAQSSVQKDDAFQGYVNEILVSLNNLRSEYNGLLVRFNDKCSEISECKKKCDRRVKEIQDKCNRDIVITREKAAKDLVSQKTNYEKEIAKIREGYNKQITDIRKGYEDRLKQAAEELVKRTKERDDVRRELVKIRAERDQLAREKANLECCLAEAEKKRDYYKGEIEAFQDAHKRFMSVR